MAPVTPQIIAAVPTPFSEDLAIDLTAFAELLGSFPQSHRRTLVAGTTGEFPALRDEERIALFAAAVEALGADQVVAHVGGSHVDQSLRLARAAHDLGISQVALLTPYFLPADAAVVRHHVEAFLDAQPGLDTFLYLFPERTGTDLTAAEIAPLVAPERVVGVKLSGAANRRWDEYRTVLRPDQQVFTGDDAELLGVTTRGGAGIISGCFAADPEPFVTALGTHPPQDAEQRVRGAVALLGRSIEHQKHALRVRTGHPWRNRMSLPRLSAEEQADIAALIDRSQESSPCR